MYRLGIIGGVKNEDVIVDPMNDYLVMKFNDTAK
jgi:hypothetical protein